MKRFIPVLLTLFIQILISCGKSGEPAPVPPPVVVVPPVVPPVTPPSGGTGGTGGTTGYTTTAKDLNTIGGQVNFDVANNKILSTGTSNANLGIVQTTEGGTVTVELLNATNANVRNLGDALDLTFAATEDPILEYTVTNETAKTKVKTDAHVNKATTGAHLVLQGNVLNSFKNNSITYDAAYAISKMKSSTQVIQKLQY